MLPLTHKLNCWFSTLTHFYVYNGLSCLSEAIIKSSNLAEWTVSEMKIDDFANTLAHHTDQMDSLIVIRILFCNFIYCTMSKGLRTCCCLDCFEMHLANGTFSCPVNTKVSDENEQIKSMNNRLNKNM